MYVVSALFSVATYQEIDVGIEGSKMTIDTDVSLFTIYQLQSMFIIRLCRLLFGGFREFFTKLKCSFF